MLKLGFWAKLCEANPDRLLSRVFRSRHRQVCAGNGALSCLTSFRECLSDVSLAFFWRSAAASGVCLAWTRPPADDSRVLLRLLLLCVTLCAMR